MIMTNTELENKVRDAYKGLAPDLLAGILEDCEKRDETVVPMVKPERKAAGTEQKEKRFAWKRWLTGIAAAFVLFAGGFYGLNGYRAANAVASTVMLDVNPSIEITVNANERVLAVTPRNEDAKKIVGDMDFKGSSLEVALNALIGSLVRNGYLSEIKNAILVSVDAKDQAKGRALEDKLMREIDALLSGSNIDGAILGQTLVKDQAAVQVAEQYGISEGKAALVRAIAESNERYEVADIASLSVQELSLIAETPATAPSGTGKDVRETIQTTGKASDAAYVGAAAAKQAALRHAGLSEADVRELECELDWEKGRMVYEVEFETAAYEYDYDVDAVTGEVLRSKKEPADDRYNGRSENGAAGTTGGTGTQATAETGAGTQAVSGGAGTQGAAGSGVTGGSAPVSSGNTVPVSREEAIRTALAHAGLTQADVWDVDCELDRENGRTVYEIDFENASYEYEYEIDVVTGGILRSKREKND